MPVYGRVRLCPSVWPQWRAPPWPQPATQLLSPFPSPLSPLSFPLCLPFFAFLLFLGEHTNRHSLRFNWTSCVHTHLGTLRADISETTPETIPDTAAARSSTSDIDKLQRHDRWRRTVTLPYRYFQWTLAHTHAYLKHLKNRHRIHGCIPDNTGRLVRETCPVQSGPPPDNCQRKWHRNRWDRLE